MIGGRSPAQAQATAPAQVIQVGHKQTRRYWVQPRAGYYKRYLRPRSQRKTDARPRYRKLPQYRKLRKARPAQARPKYKRKRKKARVVRNVPKPSAWMTQNLPDGPVQIVVSLPQQRLTVYKGGETVVTSPVSTGRPGYDTPSGVFSVLEKRRVHYSRKYDNAPMPHMQRLTWSGIALHGGRLPGYPASHGCIRLPYKFARELFSYTKRGAQVIIAKRDTAPVKISHPILFKPTTVAEVVGRDRDLRQQADRTLAGTTRVAALDASVAGTTADTPMQPFAEARARAASEQLADIEHMFARAETISSRSSAPLRIAVTKWTALERVRTIQKLLDELGYDVGPIDGKAGRRTVGAIKAYEKANGLPVTGMVTDTLVASLAAAAGRPSVETGHLYVRQNGKPLFDAPVTLKDGPRRLGTHLFTALDFSNETSQGAWTAMTLDGDSPDDSGAEVGTPAEALDRLEMPDYVRQKLADLLTPGSTMIVTDNGISNETLRGTDLIVEVN